MYIHNRTPEKIHAEINDLKAQLAEMAGEPFPLYDNGEKVAARPQTGFVLEVSWAISDRSYTDWYPTIGAAKAALHKLAMDNNSLPSASGLSVDLTSPGCHSSRAWIEPSGEDVEVWAVKADMGNVGGPGKEIPAYEPHDLPATAMRVAAMLRAGHDMELSGLAALIDTMLFWWNNATCGRIDSIIDYLSGEGKSESVSVTEGWVARDEGPPRLLDWMRERRIYSGNRPIWNTGKLGTTWEGGGKWQQEGKK